ncbi:hypothetical protein V1264_009397 [Littorina saxatilis]
MYSNFFEELRRQNLLGTLIDPPTVIRGQSTADQTEMISDGDLNSQLSALVRKQKWERVVNYLASHRSILCKDLCQRAIKEVSWNADEECLYSLVRVCAEEELEPLLTQMVNRNMWDPIRNADTLMRKASDTQRKWVLKKAVERADDWAVQEFIAEHPADSPPSLLSKLVRRALWGSVGVALRCCVVGEAERRWVIGRASRDVNCHCFSSGILPHCEDGQLDSVARTLVRLGAWPSLAAVFGRKARFSCKKWAFEEAFARADRDTLIRDMLPLCPADGKDDLVTILVERRRWDVLQYAIQKDVSDDVWVWAADQASKGLDKMSFSEMIQGFPFDRYCPVLALACQRGASMVAEKMMEFLRWDSVLSDSIALSLSLTQVDTKATVDDECASGTAHDEMHMLCEEIVRFVSYDREEPACVQINLQRLSQQGQSWTKTLNSALTRAKPMSVQTKYYAYFMTLYCKHHLGEDTDWTLRIDPKRDQTLLFILANVPLFIELQQAALRVLLRHGRWDVISLSCMTHVWEQVRRELLQAAVEQKQWHVVKQWADHTLYDDQRGWVLQEAFTDQQWPVFLLLADHGLTKTELMRVHYRLAKYADWDTFLQLLERGGDIRELKDLVQATKQGKKNLIDQQTILTNKRRRVKLAKLKRQLAKCTDTLDSAFDNSDWRLVLYRVQRNSSEVDLGQLIRAVVERKVWHVVMQLVKRIKNSKARDSLFLEMVREKQWAVSRVLLDQGVSVKFCVGAVPELLSAKQWVLLARVMEHDVDDDLRRQIMQHAMDNREGSMASTFIRTMHGCLIIQEREDLFQMAVSNEIWQAVKPLVEETDHTGLAHRDVAMREAVQHCQWDLVDHCERHYATVNVTAQDGRTLLHKAADASDWSAVQKLVWRDGDQSVTDADGYSVLHKVLQAGQPDTAKLLVQFHGDINLPDPKGVTPLQALIDRRYADVLEDMLFWQPDTCSGGVTERGETTLHALCEAGRWESLYYLVARGADPLTLTQDGQSVLMFAVCNDRCPQRGVANCVELGFSAHQPRITDKLLQDKGNTDSAPREESIRCNQPRRRQHPFFQRGPTEELWSSENVSPFEYAFVHNMPEVRNMLYESGSCSYKELFRLYARVLNDETFCPDVTSDLPYLRDVATTPRSLMSTCRLVISLCLNVRGKRRIDVQCLRLPKSAKNYVMFSDLTDADFGN